jgi:ATP-binding cassette subfamily F protein 3
MLIALSPSLVYFACMALLTATNLTKSFGPNDIFESITFSIPKRARVAIVGPNGIGKTTLLRILVGLDDPSQGVVHRAKGLRIGYLPQEATTITHGTLWSMCLSPFQNLMTMSAELTHLEKRMADPPVNAEILNRYGTLQTTFENQGGYTYENRIKQTLTGLGFEVSDYHRPINQLSGGQRTRAVLARLLLESPDLLLLDEPTNHLDITAVEWLESYLKDWEGAVVIVSHDRYFLDQVAHAIWEMTPAIEIYRGNYTAYLHQREERYARRLAEFEAQHEFIEKEEGYIRRNIAGQNTSQAKGRQRRLSRLLEEARLLPPTHAPRRMHMRLEPVARSGELVLRTYDLQIGYHDEGHPLFYCPDLLLQRLECTAIIGPNGAGKTTFLKTILDKIPPYAGQTQLGASLKIAYFAQAHEDLNPDKTLMEEIGRVAPNLLPAEVRNYLAKYLFTGEDVFRQVSTLSGGERGRLALAKLALSDANLLLLDEPTNHLDLPTQEVLQSILSDYHGTIILVSHDRYLIDALATQIWEVDPELATLHVFKGSYTEYRLEKATRDQMNTENKPPETKPVQTKRKASAEKQLLSRNQEQQLHKQMSHLESEIEAHEIELGHISARLENPPDDPIKVQQIGQSYNQIRSKIDTLTQEWEALAAKLV